MVIKLGCAHDIDPDDPRQEEWAKQREEWGFDVTELWNLDVTTCEFLAPKLRRFEEWRQIARDLVEGFEIGSQVEFVGDSDKGAKVDRAFRLLAEHWDHLWD